MIFKVVKKNFRRQMFLDPNFFYTNFFKPNIFSDVHSQDIIFKVICPRNFTVDYFMT